MATNKSLYEVLVSNLGCVHSSHNGFEANTTFQIYAGQSKRKYGRAANETVTMLRDGEPVKEYEGKACHAQN